MHHPQFAAQLVRSPLLSSRASKLNFAVPNKYFQFHPRGPRPCGSAAFCVLNPLVATNRAGGRAGGAFQG
eukprot:15452313-Alexandrium_andersonii.AAC.1